MPKILITPAVYASGKGPWRDVLDAAGMECVFPPHECTQIDKATFIRDLQGIDGTLASVERYDEEVFANSKLRCVARVGVGYDAVDVPAATKHGVAVAITPGTNEHSVAEQAISLITSVFRDLARRDREIRRGIWRRDCPRRLAGNTIGLVGLGRIGKAMAPRCQGLGLKMIGFDPFADRATVEKLGIQLVSFEELLAQADIVSLHMPCTKETTDLFNATTFAKMRPNSVLINTSRGGLVDENALMQALDSGRLFGAGLDVCKIEPLPANSPLLKYEQISFAPHLGGIDQTALDAMGQLAAQCLVDLFQGRWPNGCIVNDALKTGWKW